MKITICCSLSFLQQAQTVKHDLQSLGHEVFLPETFDLAKTEGIIDAKAWFFLQEATKKDVIRADRMRLHFNKVELSDAVLVLNYDKKGTTNYIGGNTFLEMGVAFWLKKPIFLLNSIPESVGYVEEIEGMQPTIISGDLSKVT